MLEVKFVRQNVELVQESLRNRGQPYGLEKFLDCDSERRAILLEVEELKHQLEERQKQGKSVVALTKRVKSKRKVIERTRQRIKDLKAKHKEQMNKQKQRLEKRKQRDKVALEKQKLNINIQEETRDYNISTSLKSYIDPRIYYEWGKKGEYDWKKYY